MDHERGFQAMLTYYACRDRLRVCSGAIGSAPSSSRLWLGISLWIHCAVSIQRLKEPVRGELDLIVFFCILYILPGLNRRTYPDVKDIARKYYPESMGSLEDIPQTGSKH